MAETMKNINIGANKKTAFTVDGDESRVIYLNTSDAGIIDRYKNLTPKMKELEDKWSKLTDTAGKVQSGDETSTDALLVFSEQFSMCERDMRDMIDYIFNSEVSDIILGAGSAFSPRDGKFEFEWIIESLSGLYNDSIAMDMQKIDKNKIRKHTGKYLK